VTDCIYCGVEGFAIMEIVITSFHFSLGSCIE